MKTHFRRHCSWGRNRGSCNSPQQSKHKRATISFPTNIYKQYMSSAVVGLGPCARYIKCLFYFNRAWLCLSICCQVGLSFLISRRAVCMKTTHLLFPCLLRGFLNYRPLKQKLDFFWSTRIAWNIRRHGKLYV